MDYGDIFKEVVGLLRLKLYSSNQSQLIFDVQADDAIDNYNNGRQFWMVWSHWGQLVANVTCAESRRCLCDAYCL